MKSIEIIYKPQNVHQFLRERRRDTKRQRANRSKYASIKLPNQHPLNYIIIFISWRKFTKIQKRTKLQAINYQSISLSVYLCVILSLFFLYKITRFFLSIAKSGLIARLFVAIYWNGWCYVLLCTMCLF